MTGQEVRADALSICADMLRSDLEYFSPEGLNITDERDGERVRKACLAVVDELYRRNEKIRRRIAARGEEEGGTA